MSYNLPYRDMAAPVVGPAHPFQKDGLAAGMRNHRAGHVEATHLGSFAFDEQYNTFHRCAAGESSSQQQWLGLYFSVCVLVGGRSPLTAVEHLPLVVAGQLAAKCCACMQGAKSLVHMQHPAAAGASKQQ